MAVALDACMVEKHFALSRDEPGPGGALSLARDDFGAIVDAIRATQLTLGDVNCHVTEWEQESRVFRRSLFVVQDMQAGEVFTEENVRSIGPGHGLQTRYLGGVLGRHATRDIVRGTPLSWRLMAE